MDELFEGLDTAQDVDTSVKNVVETNSPSPISPEWNDYVLGLFESSEMYDGRPLCHGLRRVAELLMGRIVSSRPTQVFAPNNSGEEIGRATVVWELVFEDGSLFSDVADCWEGNTDDAFCVFNTATAATRAEGRALRKALRLRTVAAEEMTKKDTAAVVRSFAKTKQVATPEYNENAPMSKAQGNFLDVLGERNDVNIELLVTKVLGGDFKKINIDYASDAIKKLNSYQQDKSTIPAEILGFDKKWRGE